MIKLSSYASLILSLTILGCHDDNTSSPSTLDGESTSDLASVDLGDMTGDSSDLTPDDPQDRSVVDEAVDAIFPDSMHDAGFLDQGAQPSPDMTLIDLDPPVDDPLINHPESCTRMNRYELTAPGPYRVSQSESGDVKIYQPEDRPNACKMPIFHFSNGTGASCGFYQPLLNHMASYGYLALCYETTQSGSGEPCMTAIETALTLYGGEVYHDRFVSSGHSQGGGAGHVCHFLLEESYPEANIISATIQPAHGMNRLSYRSEYPLIRGPIFTMSGTLDTVVSDAWIYLGYQLFTTEKYWYIAIGATHFNFHNWAKTSILSFSQWKLFDDEQARQSFVDLLQSPQTWIAR